MQIGFPSPVMGVEVTQNISKGGLGGLGVRQTQGFSAIVLFTAPILLKKQDLVWVDTRNGKVETIEREGITIWRAAWAN
jgi:hypothetical protein